MACSGEDAFAHPRDAGATGGMGMDKKIEPLVESGTPNVAAGFLQLYVTLRDTELAAHAVVTDAQLRGFADVINRAQAQLEQAREQLRDWEACVRAGYTPKQ